MTTQSPQHEGLRDWLSAPQAPPPWSLGETALLLGVLAISMLMVGSAVAIAAAPSSATPPGSAFLLGWLIGLVLTGAFVMIRWRQNAAKFAALRLGEGRFPTLIMALVGIGAGATADLIAALSSEFGTVAALRGVDEAGIGVVLLAALFVVLVQPIVEALVFAGVVLPRLRASVGAWGGLLATTLLFTAYHYLVFGARLVGSGAFWYGIVVPFIVGAVMLAMRVYVVSTQAAMAVNIGAGVVALGVLVLLG